MATALVLASDGRREGGRWRRGSVDVGNDQSVNNSDWQQRLRKCGVVLDFAPDLADHVVSGDLALVLADDGRRENGRWKRNTTGNTARGNSEQGWRNRLAEAGVILDHAPELAGSVKSGNMPLREALRQAEDRRDAERLLLKP